MAPTRCGEMQAMTIIGMAFADGADRKALENRVNMAGGLMDHLGTADVMEIKKKISEGDKYTGENEENASLKRVKDSFG